MTAQWLCNKLQPRFEARVACLSSNFERQIGTRAAGSLEGQLEVQKVDQGQPNQEADIMVKCCTVVGQSLGEINIISAKLRIDKNGAA